MVEIDLLRGGKPMPILGMQSTLAYRILISRGHQRPVADLYRVSLQQLLPAFSVPLKLTDTEPTVSLQDVLNGVYDRSRYATRIDYHQTIPPPALSGVDQQWVEVLLAPVR